MSLWLIRGGAHGEYEKKFLNDNRVYLTWHGLKEDLGKIKDINALRGVLTNQYPDATKNKIIHHSSQIWAFSRKINKGDWIVLPSKYKSSIHVGEILSEYTFSEKSEDPFYHFREVKWIKTDIPRTNFDQDMLYSFGAFMTICQIQRNNAEDRIKAMGENNWKSIPVKVTIEEESEPFDSDSSLSNLEDVARDQIARLIIAKFKGHGMSRLVNGILKAQGYRTYMSPPGADKGIDILAATGPLGFGSPKICVQVKSEDDPISRPILTELIGSMESVKAEQGLLVSWSGFKSTIEEEEANKYFSVRLWDQNDLIEQLLLHYDKLDDSLKAELPLKRIWTVTTTELENE